MMQTSRDGQSLRFPVSIKGVIFIESTVILLKNERDEWELPGGKLESGEQPETCLAREIEEELGLAVRVGPILDSWLYNIQNRIEVVVMSYGCTLRGAPVPRLSHEHKELGLFARDEIASLALPDGYRRAIRAWQRLQGI